MSDQARILDQGYRTYAEERGGVGHAVRTLTLFSLGRVLGLRRGFWPKVLPIAIIVISCLPAVVFVGMAALLPEGLGDDVVDYGEYYGFISSAIWLFAAFVAPELLCTDRRTRMIGLYFASPLDRMTYLASKALAVVASLAVVTIGPPLLMLLAFTIEGSGPDGVGDVLAILWRILVSGTVVAGVYTSLSLAIASLTDRNGFASAAVILALFLSGAVASALVDGAGASETFRVVDLLNIPLELVLRIYDTAPPNFPEIATGTLVAANVAWTALFLGIVVWRYRRLEVTR
ncbi:ABC-2 transporter permease [Actinomarinicola tropica]|uniref:ABC transporter permease subunit n=1 Tax=Actinomarinicola tropica TaxID=2789776 RepID=A0A5Q2RKU2_9ACTN|nr:ABC transporter permease subunit [Actinomarinicola tropica]QGG94677.1 ABC transporter permease subunit [Actinomarinicola tropica]